MRERERVREREREREGERERETVRLFFPPFPPLSQFMLFLTLQRKEGSSPIIAIILLLIISYLTSPSHQWQL